MNVPPDSGAGADPELLRRVAVVTAGMALLLALLRLALHRDAPTTAVTLCCALALCSCVGLAMGRRTTSIAAYLLPTSVLIGAGTGALLEGGLSSIPALWLPFVPVLAVFTLGVRAQLPASGAALLVLAILLFTDLFGSTTTPALANDGPTAVRFLVLGMNTVFGGTLASAYHAQRARAEMSLRYHATHDSLTDLPNRRALFQRLDLLLGGHMSRQKPIVVIMADLDHFKAINDQHGHAAGDFVLREVAARLVAGVRAQETVFRLAGDEFVILCDDLEQSDLSGLCARVADMLSAPAMYRGTQLPLSVSLGIARSSPGCTARGLLESADMSMYEDKRARRVSRSGPIPVEVQRDKLGP